MSREECENYYNSLSEKEQFLLEIIAVKAGNIDVITIQNMAASLGRTLIQKDIKNFFKILADNDLIAVNQWQSTYKINPYFLINIFPLIKNVKKIIATLPKTPKYYYYQPASQEVLRDALNALLFGDTGLYRTLETDLRGANADIKSLYVEIIENDAYKPYLNKISPPLLETAFNYKANVDLFHLVAFSETKNFFERIKPYVDKKLEFPLLANEFLYGGQIDKALAVQDIDENISISYFLPAIKLLQEDRADESVKQFEKGLKFQRRIFFGTYLPYGFITSLYYITALMRTDSKTYIPVFKRIIKSFDKTYPTGYNLFLMLSEHVVGQNTNNDYRKRKLEESLFRDDIVGLTAMTVFYLCNFKTDKQILLKNIFALIEKADNAGFTGFALEAAYALRQIDTDKRSEELYHRMAAKVDYTPYISKIVQTEEWEKAINLLIGLQPKTAKNNDKDAIARVVYFFNPKRNSIQPVLQTRQVKGWSKGRNIAMKSFASGNVQGMTEHDHRVVKSLVYNSYYYDYSFKDSVFKELIGHPHIFLEGINEIPVEFIEGKPQIIVEKQEKNYVLKTNVIHNEDEKKVHIEKETNTRYKIYDFSDRQLELLRIIKEKKITVPESGKDKLIELLTVLSTQKMEVHSDLFASGNSHVTVENVTPDSKIRVQLLPFGEGLKAELFSKPFGDSPPYCKPAKGGKVLFRNGENDIRFQVKRDMKQELENETSLMNDIQSLETLEMQDGLITFTDPLDSLYMLDILKNHIEICIIEWPEGERFKIRGTADFGNLKLSLKTKNNWFDLQGELAVDENLVLSLQQLLLLTEKSHGRFVELSTGEFLALSADLKKRLDDLRMFSSSDKKNITINKFASIALDGFLDDVEHLKTDKAWKDFRKRVNDTQIEEMHVPATLQAELRPYQEEGFRWMTRLAQWEAGACLADDMGLGKTVQALAVLLQRAQLGAALVVCPVSVIGNWINEINRFAPSMNVKTLGNANRKQTLDELQAGDILITSYGLLQSEEELFRDPEFATIVLDEAHAIKNFATKTSKATMQLKGAFRIALTGTPIQNHLGEIWNLFNFINPGLLGNLTQFTDRFVKPEDESARKRLKKLIAPFILRRTKTKVLDELPPKTEIVKKIRLSDAEMAFYEALRRQALENIAGSDAPAGAKHLQVLAEITRLRQACCNPKLIDKSTDIPSAKLQTFLEIVNELMENKHRALVFSQFVTHLAIAREALDKMKIDYQYLDGSTPAAEREKRVRAFQSGKGQLFLISLKAGGLGLNLTAADFVIHLDPWWNPAVEDQASDRAHRIGQTRPVTIYRLVAENTIEEKIVKLHDTKRDLAETLLEGSDRSARLSMGELMELIKNAQ